MKDIDEWIAINKLKLNKRKTELIVIESEHRPKTQLEVSLGPDNAAGNIRVILDDKFNFEKQIATICKSSIFFHTQNIARIRRFLSYERVKTLVHAFITCRLDNCNSLL